MPDTLSPEAKRALQAWLEDKLGDLPERFGPIARPDRFSHLTEHQRGWLAGKSKTELERLDALLRIDPDRVGQFIRDFNADDLIDLKEAIRFARSARTVGRFSRMLILVVVGVVGATVTFGQQVGTIWKWLVSGGR